MSVMTQRSGGGGGGNVERAPGGGSSSLADVVALILDKGLVIDVFVRVSLVGIEILTIDARIVVASVDTYLRFAEATNRLDLYEKGGKDLPGACAGDHRGRRQGQDQRRARGGRREGRGHAREQSRAAQREEVRRRPVRQRARETRSEPESRPRGPRTSTAWSRPTPCSRRICRGSGRRDRCRPSRTAAWQRSSATSRWTGRWACGTTLSPTSRSLDTARRPRRRPADAVSGRRRGASRRRRAPRAERGPLPRASRRA